jgi:hypothetical protein
MSAILFLLVVVVVSLVGGIVLWLQHRNPQTMDSGIADFHREMKALAPPTASDDRRSRTVRPQRQRKEG